MTNAVNRELTSTNGLCYAKSELFSGINAKMNAKSELFSRVNAKQN